jgi:competence protein ComEC
VVEAGAAARHDLRMPALGVAAWAGGMLAEHLGDNAGWGLVVVLVVLGWTWWHGRGGPLHPRRTLALTMLVVGAAVLCGSLLRHDAVRASPLHDWATQRATADLLATVVSDPRTVEGQWGDRVVVRLRVERVSARGADLDLGGTVVLLGDPSWTRVALGERVLAEGRLAPSDSSDVAALLTTARAPARIRGPDVWWRAAGALRASIRAAVAHRPAEQAGLVPALVDGDDAGLPPELEADFRTTGLTHLTAVSGTNLTLVVGSLLLLARGVGVRGRWLVGVGILGIVGFVLLARTEPSVLRAAAMGTVGLFAFGPDGRRRGLRALGAALVGLMLVEPRLATSPGFALSVLATAGIVLLGPPLSEALARWLPRGAAEAVAVPTAAQLACTPVVAVLSGQVSLVAVLANLLAGPLVGPTTVLGLLAGLAGLLWPVAGTVLGTGAAWCVAGIIEVAQRGAVLPGASVAWGTGAGAVALLVVICLVIGLVLPRLLRRPGLAAALGVVLLLVVLGVPGRLSSISTGGWPPDDWVVVACDVGQGDALVVRTGAGAAIVVDAGPDAGAVDGCLDRLDVREVPLVVLTHFHADHVDGLTGILQGRRVAAIEASPVLDPPSGAEQVREVASAAGVPLRTAPFGATRRYGDAVIQVVHPDLAEPVPGAGDGSSANDASVVLLVEVRGIRLLLTGDVEPPAQAELGRTLTGLDVDVLKVPHHGSAHQDERWLASLDPELALVSVGADNDYGHPAPGVLDRLSAAGAEVLRTDTGGDVAVVVDEAGRPRGATRR